MARTDGALRARAAALSVPLEGTWVQRMIEGGVELLVTAFRDRAFGVMVGCGLGGKTVWYAETGTRQVVAVDLAWDHVSQTARFAADRGVGERIHVARADAMLYRAKNAGRGTHLAEKR